MPRCLTLPLVALLGTLVLVPLSPASAAPDGAEADTVAERPARPPQATAPRVDFQAVDLQDRLNKILVEPTEDGGYRVQFQTPDGPAWVDGDRFIEMVYRRQEQQREAGWMYVILNITSPIGIAWVGLGLLGQVLFSGRMLLQWVASEREKRSVIPSAFWWMSLGGATMLIVYFIWRKDVVGVLGQSTGWFIYLRNIWMIYRPQPDASTPTSEPEQAAAGQTLPPADPAPQPVPLPASETTQPAAAMSHGS